VRYKPLSTLQLNLGLEYLYWQTRYKDAQVRAPPTASISTRALF
jgi:hypothetical protein